MFVVGHRAYVTLEPQEFINRLAEWMRGIHSYTISAARTPAGWTGQLSTGKHIIGTCSDAHPSKGEACECMTNMVNRIRSGKRIWVQTHGPEQLLRAGDKERT